MHPKSLHLNHAASFFLKVLLNDIWLHVNISMHIADSINYIILTKGFLLGESRNFYGNHGPRFKSFTHYTSTLQTLTPTLTMFTHG